MNPFVPVKSPLGGESDTDGGKPADTGKGAKKIAKVSRSKKAATNFLVATFNMVEAENSPETVRWASDGNSFVISNTEKFIRVLPRYFKTKNYSSFVRQLNMYNFHKVKNKEGLHEFKHEHFKRGHRDQLRFINRKIAEVPEPSQVEIKDRKSIVFENNRLKKQIVENEESLGVVSAQTKLVIDTNKDLIYKIWKSKTENDVKIRKLLFLFFSLLSNTEADLIRRIKTVFMRSAGFDMSPDDFILDLSNVSNFIQALIQNVFSSTEKEDACIASLMDGFLEAQNATEPNDSNRMTMDLLLNKLQLNGPLRPTEEGVRGYGALAFPQFMRESEEQSQADQISSFGNSLPEGGSIVNINLTNFKLDQSILFAKNASGHVFDDHSLYGGSNSSFDLRTPFSEKKEKGEH